MATLQIRLLGQFTVESATTPLEFHASTAHLLAYLALSFGRLVPRTRIAGMLWPDASESRARANLSTVTWRLRQTLSRQGSTPDVVRRNGDSLGLDTNLCEVDVESFKRDSVAPGASAISLDAMSRAVHAADSYGGDLLEDWDVEWCRLDREQLRQRFLHTLRALAEGFERIRRYDLALQYAKRAAEADPFSEPAQRVLMRLLFRTGDKASAITQFNRFAVHTRSELGVEPDSETLALLGQIKRSGFESGIDELTEPEVPPLIRAEKVPMVGRIKERQEVGALLDAAVASTGGGVLITGEAGIGKSRLADWAMEEWAARGGLTARGRCIEFNDPVPYQPVLDSLGSIVDIGNLANIASYEDSALASMFLGEGTAGATYEGRRHDQSWPAGKLRLFNWVRVQLEEASRRRPLLVVIEDLQWADASSVDFIAYMLERARSMFFALLISARPSGSKGGQAAGIDRLSRHCSVILRMGPLTDVETAELVQVLLDGRRVSSDMMKWIHAETEGNPLFVIETIRLLHQQGRISDAGAGLATSSEDPTQLGLGLTIPDGVRSAVQQRLELIDPASLRVAQIASVLGRNFDEELLSMVASMGANRLSRAVGNLIRGGIFERENAGYRFAHDKIRAVCYENLSARVRRLYHARAAAALTQMPDVPVHRLAWHQLSAGQWDVAADSWEKAGDDAREVHAHEESLSSYGHAISCLRRDAVRDAETMDLAEIRLLVKSDEVLAILGRPNDRKNVLDRIGVLCRRTSRASCQVIWLTRKALLEDHVGNFSFAAGLARRASCMARGEGDLPAEVEALRVLAWTLYRAGRSQRSLAISHLALKKMGGTKSLSTAAVLWQAAAVYIMMSDYASASAYIERARGISIELGLITEHHLILLLRALVDRSTGDLQAARAGLLRALHIAREAGDLITGARVTFPLASIDANEGRLGDALRRLRMATVASRSTGFVRIQMGCLNEAAYGIGRLIGNYWWAWKASAHALRLARASGNRILFANYKSTQSQLLLEEGRLEEAIITVCEVLHALELERCTTGPYPENLALRGVILLESGKAIQAIADLEEARRGQITMGDRLILVDTLTHLALAYAKLGDAERALSTSDEALHLLAEINYANMQPQRIFWHHYQILEMFNHEPRLPFLKRAVEFIDAQGSTLSKAQQRRFRRDVRLNREILEAWERHQQDLQSVPLQAAPTSRGTVVPIPAAHPS